MLEVISAVITLSVKCALRGQTFRACGIITISKYSALVGDLQYNAENAAIYSGLFCLQQCSKDAKWCIFPHFPPFLQSD